MRSYAFAARAAVLALLSYSSAMCLGVEATGVPWRTNLDAAKLEAAQTGKPLLLHFWTPTCGPCRVLEKTVFNQPHVAEGLQQNFVPVKVNADTSVALASAFQIRSVPTDVVITAQGNVVTTMGCPNKPDPYLSQLVHVADQLRRNSPTTGAANASPPINAAYAGLETGQYSALTRINNAQSANKTPSSPQPTMAERTQSNPYISSAPQVAAESRAVAPQTPGPGQAEARYAPAPPATPSVAPPETQAAQASASVAVTNRAESAQDALVAESIVRHPSAAAVDLPRGAAPLAFDGYCPVSLKFDNKWVAGDVMIGMEHRGRTYLFASEQHRRQFVADPDGYCPVFDGHDPVVMLEERDAVEGSRRYGYRYDGAFYLFSSAGSMAKFKADPASYAHGVQMAMRQLGDATSGTIRR